MRIACIVEGKGDALSVPILVRRIGAGLGRHDLEVAGPFRVPRSTLVRQGELERAVERAARAPGQDRAVLVLIDADDDLPCQFGPALQRRASDARPDMPVAVVLANREKEAWFIAAAGGAYARTLWHHPPPTRFGPPRSGCLRDIPK
jgi:hypothetical protein